jgi:tRNA-dihydrouridine synthase
VAKLNFNGIDINMGCPQDTIIKQHAGADLIRDPKRAKEIVEAVREGVKAAGKKTPVSVKTRIGFSKDMLEEWIPELLSLDLPALTIHARTQKDMSKVPARWECVARTVELRDTYAPNTLIIGNGDVVSVSDGIQKAQKTGADGIMIGRAVFGNPWIFVGREFEDISTQEKISTLIEHTKLYEEMHGNKNFAIMKKHYSAYVRGFDGAKELRIELMNADTYEDVYNIAGEFLRKM